MRPSERFDNAVMEHPHGEYRSKANWGECMSKRVLAALMAATISVMGMVSITQAVCHSDSAAKASTYQSDGKAMLPASSEDEGPPAVELYPDAWDIPESVAVVPSPDGTGSIIVGVEIGSIWGESTAEQVQSWIEDPDSDDTVRVLDKNGQPLDYDEQVSTGMVVEVVSPDGEVVQQSEIAVTGDVAGTGEIGLTQIVCLAGAMKDEALDGARRLAADVNGDDKVSVTDIVQLTQMERDNTFEVDCVVTGEDLPAILEAAGYYMEPWASEMAVISAGIPDSVNVEVIEWTQRDVLPGGMEQTLFYEGLERTLIFGALDEGSTTVTTVVTTESGKSVEREVEITWDGDR